jgi:AcrR family transcriptional regulator
VTGGIARRPAAETRRAILAAARELAREHGWPHVTMRRLAQRTGLSPMAAYRHFESRDALLLALLREGFGALRERLTEASAAAPEPVAAVHAAVEAYVAFAFDERDLYLVMYDLGGIHLDPVQTWQEGTAVGEAVAALLTAATGTPTAAMDDAVLNLWAPIHGLVALDVAGRLPGSRDTVLRLAHDAADATLRVATPAPRAS